MKELTNIMALELTPLSSSWHALVTSSIKSVTEHHIHLHKFRVLGRGSSLHFQLQGAHCIFIYHVWAECWSAGVLDWSFGLRAGVVDCECWSAGVVDACWSAGVVDCVLECWSVECVECWSSGLKFWSAC